MFEYNSTNAAVDYSLESLFNNIMVYRPVAASSDREIEVAAWNRQNSTFSRRNVTMESDTIAFDIITMNLQSSCALLLQGPDNTYYAYVALASKSGASRLHVSISSLGLLFVAFYLSS